MNATLRNLTAGIALFAGTTAMAQYPYTWTITGTVVGCYPGQTVTIESMGATSPGYSFTLPVDSATCTWGTSLGFSSAVSTLEISTLCGGAVSSIVDSVSFGFLLDSVATSYTFSCIGPLDCMGVPGGPDMPGTPCDDGNPMTTGDTWSSACTCTGIAPPACGAIFTVQQSAPWTISTTNSSWGTGPLTYEWWMPDGSPSTAFEPGFTFLTSGIYGICLTITDSTGCSSWQCDTLVVDSAGMLYTGGGVWFDCLGVLFGPDVYGAPCDDGDSTTINDEWTSWCACVGTSTGPLDCLGIPGGSALPGTLCVDSIGGMIVTGLWDVTCTCVTSAPVDCLGIPGGSDMPGTPCNDGDPLTVNDMWDASCNCVGTSSSPCQADFWVLQAYTYDSLFGTATPIPYELWVWNLSSGGSGTYTFLWNFGDGTSSTDPFPTHNYSGNGPYNLCLTIDDGMGCTSTHCDSVSIDSAGMYAPFTGGNTQRSSGFTINVKDPGATGIAEPTALSGLVVWPNPVDAELNFAVNSGSAGTADLSIHDMTGRVVWQSRQSLVTGHNNVLVGTASLVPGMYVLRIGEGNQSIGQRFVKR